MKKLLLAFLLIFFNLNAQKNTNCVWDSIGTGVNSICLDSSSSSIFIGFAGWSVKQSWANNWVHQLYLSKLKSLNVGFLYSVKGPDTPCYNEQEIDNLSLATNLINLINNKKINKVIIAAHSSGSFVAHHLFKILFADKIFNNSSVLAGKIFYFNLDGGIGSQKCGVPIDSSIAENLAHIYAVYAYDDESKIFSPNKDDMIELHKKFENKSTLLQMDVTGSKSTGKWSVHDALINQKPYNPTSFNLEKDYNNINSEHPVFDTYLNKINK